MRASDYYFPFSCAFSGFCSRLPGSEPTSQV